MQSPRRRILLSVEPAFLQGALAELLATDGQDEIVQASRGNGPVPGGAYDAAVVATDLPGNVQTDVLITLPDTRGSAGTGTVKIDKVIHEVSITTVEQVMELLNRYAPRRGHRRRLRLP